MKKMFFALMVLIVSLSSCTVTIPTLSNLNNETMLLAENKNIKADYTLNSNVLDGNISYVSVLKNGSETVNNAGYKYNSESAFKKMWGTYFSSKFNNLSKDEMVIEVTLKNLILREQAGTSIGVTMLTGNSTANVDAIAIIHVVVNYRGNIYENEYEVVASDYNESQMRSIGNYSYTSTLNNPTQQKAQLLESCLNKSVVQFENIIRSIIMDVGNN